MRKILADESRFSIIYNHRIHVRYIYANIGGILMVNVTIYSIHGSYGIGGSTTVPVFVWIILDQDVETVRQAEERLLTEAFEDV